MYYYDTVGPGYSRRGRRGPGGGGNFKFAGAAF